MMLALEVQATRDLSFENLERELHEICVCATDRPGKLDGKKMSRSMIKTCLLGIVLVTTSR